MDNTFILTEEQETIINNAVKTFKDTLKNAGVQLIVGVDIEDDDISPKTKLMIAPLDVIVKDESDCTDSENDNCYLSYDLPRLELDIQEYYPEATTLVKGSM